MQRRDFIKLISGAFAFVLALHLSMHFAAAWNKAAFETTKLNEAEKGLEINSENHSQDILITAPDKAENGAIVQVEVKSNIPNTEAISI